MKEKLKSQNTSKILVILALAFMSFVSVFGIYNTFTFNIVNMISTLETFKEQFANFAILIIFSGTLLYVNSINFARREFMERTKVFGVLAGSITAIVLLMLLANSLLHPLVSMGIIGISFMLFRMMFSTIGLIGVFSVIAIFIAFPVIAYKAQLLTTAPALLTAGQALLTLVVFVGATYPRLRALLFQVRTRDISSMPDQPSQDQEHQN